MKSLIFFLIVTLIAMASCVNRSNHQNDVVNEYIDTAQVTDFLVINNENIDSLKTNTDPIPIVNQLNDSTTFTEVEMGSITTIYFSKKTLKESYNILLLKDYADVEYLHKEIPLSNIQYRNEDDEVDVSYVFADKMNLTITLLYAGGVTTIELLQKADGTTMTVTMSAD